MVITTEALYNDYLIALCSGAEQQALRLVYEAQQAGIAFQELCLAVLQPALHEVGRLWATKRLDVAQEHQATAITRRVLDYLVAEDPRRQTVRTLMMAGLRRTMVATCAPGERHDIGLRMVSDFFATEGWRVHYLGADMPVREVVDLVNREQADLLAVSVTLTDNLLAARALIDAIRLSPLGPRLTVMAGGQAVQAVPNLYRRLGADLTAPDASVAVETMTARWG